MTTTTRGWQRQVLLNSINRSGDPFSTCVGPRTIGGMQMHQQGGTIKEALDSIASREYVLPAIQREFVWRPEQVCNLFDSLMQGYPIGEVMFWRVEAQNSRQNHWYDFVRGNTQEGLVETGESRTPRPEGPMSGCATSLFGGLFLARGGFHRRNPPLTSRFVFRRLLSTLQRLHPGLLAPASPLPGIEVSRRSRRLGG